MLTCRLLGPVEVWSDGEQLDLGFPRQRTLLAILLVEANRLVTVETLIDRIWGEQPPARAAHALYADVSKLRRALAPASAIGVVRRTGGYVVEADPAAVDLHRFRTLRAQAHPMGDSEDAAALLDQALALWCGEAFAGLGNPWLTSHRASLDSERLDATLDRNDAYLRLGRHAQLLTELTGLIATRPLDERLAAQHMLALHRCGRTTDALTQYQHVRGLLADELGVDPSPELRQLHQDILRDDPRLRVATTPSPVDSPTPRQLPGQARHFVGRAAELRQLSALLDNAFAADGVDGIPGAGGGTCETVVISAIGGAGGIGKTWLALHWAHEHRDRFPDGQLFVDLRGFTPTGDPVTPLHAVRGFLEGLGADPDRIPGDLDARVALYRSILATRRMLIVLDNAADAAQVTPLLPGSPTCTVVITSRRYLPSLHTGYQAHHLQLGVLAETEGRQLLSARLGADRVVAETAAVDALLACCGGFPLALSIVIGRALAHPEFPLAVLAAELADTTSALGVLDDADTAASLPAALSWSMRGLSTEQALVFGLLGIAPGPDTSLSAAACLTALPAQRVRAALRELEHASLIQQHAPGRYRMHDLIRLYAADTAHHDIAPDARDAALRRVLDFYTHTSQAANRLLTPRRLPIEFDPPAPDVHPQPLPDVAAALAWLDAEHPTLLAAQDTAAHHVRHSTVWQLAWNLDTFHARRGYGHDRLVMWRAALDASAHLADPTTRIIAHRVLGTAYASLTCHDDGIRHLSQALALAEERHDHDQQAHAHRFLAWARAGSGDNRRAVHHATCARDLFRMLGQAVWEADALNEVGWYAAQLGEYDTARGHCQAALTMHRDHQHPNGEACTLGNLGYISDHTGEYADALGYYRQSLEILREVGDSKNEAKALDWMGKTHTALGEHEQARVVWQEAIKLYEDQSCDTDAERVRRQLDASQ